MSSGLMLIDEILAGREVDVHLGVVMVTVTNQ